MPRRCRRGKSGVMLFPPWTARWGTWSTFEDLREGFGTQNCPDFTSGRSVPEDWPDFLSVRIHIFSLASFHESLLWQRFNGFNQLQYPLLMVVKNIGTRPFNHGLGRVRTTSVTSFFSFVSFVVQLELWYQRQPCGLVSQYVARNIGAMVVGNAPYAVGPLSWPDFSLSSLALLQSSSQHSCL